ncbi:hypothetical protein [Paraburkholderia guartelaensis]|uniref:hypothetical protein n=1 Tax=Paraburkholderia guartelaensis TaxID=2546446 RepID=UPI002AB7BFFA|nr:hypothetical protein [Paraburkholderia guartelaensis]
MDRQIGDACGVRQAGEEVKVVSFVEECGPFEPLQDNVLRLFWDVVPCKPCHAELTGNPMWGSDPTGIDRLTLREWIYDQILWGVRARLRREQAFFMASIR